MLLLKRLKRLHKFANQNDIPRRKRLYVRSLKTFCDKKDLCGDIGNGSRGIVIIHHFLYISIKWKWENLGRKLNVMSNCPLNKVF